MAHQGFGFCEFLAEDDAEYAVKIMNQIKLFGKPIRVNKASYDKKQLDVGANLFVGNIDAGVDENALYDTFSKFGAIAEHPKIARDASTGESKGYGFVSFLEFEAADMAVENMNGQFLGGKQVSVQYAFKKDGKGERHGTQAERLLAAQAKKQSFGGFSQPAYVPPVAPVPVAAPPPLPAGFAPANVIGAPPAPGYGAYPPQQQQYGAYPQQGYEGYAQNGYGAPPPPPQQYAAGAPPPPPPIRMGFNQ
ncbi:hypothetical protein VHUM_03370 [Vanrija humicola]|uniref:RRM domain-containing protein n=1 Tax=Vanrija humicola TaxID=5417 RepID=A0A7D8YXC5_VANHU|nr:hypothetical protein VHUM_03370 [Vanrija humicola]